MAKKEKMTTTEIIDKIIKTLDVLLIPVTTIIAIWWDFDAAVYVAATVAAINGVLECLEVYMNAKENKKD